jgi:hypothetical protein
MHLSGGAGETWTLLVSPGRKHEHDAGPDYRSAREAVVSAHGRPRAVRVGEVPVRVRAREKLSHSSGIDCAGAAVRDGTWSGPSRFVPSPVLARSLSTIAGMRRTV